MASSLYYISPSAIGITPNAKSNNPYYVGISVVGGTQIRVRNYLYDKNGDKVNVGYTANLSYRTWTLTGNNTYVGDDYNKKLYIYARLESSTSSSEGLVMLSPIDHDAYENEYYYIKLGWLSAPGEGNVRTLNDWDTGELDTAQGNTNDKNGDFDKAFSVTNTYITALKPFHGLQIASGYALTLGTIAINAVKTATDNFTSWANETAIATTSSIAAYITAKLNELNDKFIRKDKDDVTNYKLTMNKARIVTDAQIDEDLNVSGKATVGGATTLSGTLTANDKSRFVDDVTFGSANTTNDKSYVQNVRGCKIWWNGTGWLVETDFLSVNKKAIFNEVEINKVSHIGGQQLLTAASCKVEHVYSTSRAYYVLFKKQDNSGNIVTNNWVANDQAYCQTFDATGSTAKSKYYWVLVMETSDKENNTLSSKTEVTCMDGEIVTLADYHWIALSKQSSNKDNPTTNESTPCVADEWSDVPEVGDDIVQLGCRDNTKPERQGATLLAGSGKWKQALVMWKKINSFVLPAPKVLISPEEVSIVADSVKFVTSDGTEKDVETELNSSNKTLELILDDDYIMPNEKTYFLEILNRAKNEDACVDSEIRIIPVADIPQSLNDAWSDYKDNAYDELDGYLTEIVETSRWDTPINLTNADIEGTYRLYLSRTALTKIITDYDKALAKFNYELSSYKTKTIGASAATEAKENAIEYVEQHIGEILDASTKTMVEGWIDDKVNGNFVQTSTFNQYKEGIQAYTSWTDEVKNQCGGTGLFTYLNTLFVGTSAITFDANGQVSNISKTGLVTSAEFAALQASLTDDKGNIITQASISTYIANGISNAVITADQVKITSGSKTFGDYFSIDNGNIWCQNITIEGVLNNLVNILQSNSDKFIQDNTEYHLDVLQMGNVVNIKGIPNTNYDYHLPYYINSTYNKRTYTKYGGTKHLITPKELTQLVGKRITFIFDVDSGPRIYGIFSAATDSATTINALVNNAAVISFPSADRFPGIQMSHNTVTMEFRQGTFRGVSGGLFSGYYWAAIADSVATSGIENDTEWNDL